VSGRIRSVKPEWLDDELLAESSSDARVLSIALLLLADDHGRGRGSDKMLAARVFPGQPIGVLRTAMTRLIAIRYCHLYVVGEQSYFEIRNWLKHQKVDKPGKEKVPPPPNRDQQIFENIPESLASETDQHRESVEFENIPESVERESESLAPRARPIPLLSSPIPSPIPSPEGVQGEPTEPVERRIPLDWKPHPAAVAELAKKLGVAQSVILGSAEEFLSYWSIGGGAGQVRRNWQGKFRDHVRKAHSEGWLRGAGPPGSMKRGGQHEDDRASGNGVRSLGEDGASEADDGVGESPITDAAVERGKRELGALLVAQKAARREARRNNDGA
jgi:hypothetical protein